MFVIRAFSDALELAGLAAAVGGITGLVTSLTRPPAGRQAGVFGIDNRIRFPRRYRNKSRTRVWGIDLGSLGPVLIGAGGAIFVVFATGVDKSQVGTGARVEIVDAIGYVQFMVLAITGGAAGELVFRTLASGGKVSLEHAQGAVHDAAAAASLEATAGSDPAVIQRKAIVAGEAGLGVGAASADDTPEDAGPSDAQR